ncbi:hypothetical protein BV22DRAFT_1075609 [Leucogyrophana mollusca]|uniref:Uncharacterized protein n=1 Tax=Leucogyrophana mollusca TaxID=85980 RepID=A0ACB8B1K3_9AGAM|nr:hypothetical protein BV22DRAFT_1075609 [Leucogyrophana mollusca]
MVRHSVPLQDSDFTLNTSGVAGFFGGDEAVSAMATVHVYEGRKWLGWYNSPGAYEVGKRYGQLANSRFWDGLFPGPNTDPATLFELDGLKGPKYRAAWSGTTLPQTGHIGALFASACDNKVGTAIEGRVTIPSTVTVAELPHIPSFTMHPRRLRTCSSLLASIPIGVSACTTVVCALVGDWYCFAMILLGIVSSGLSCFVIGSGTFTFTHPKPADGAPVGDGVMFTESGVIILKGEEAAVNSVTRGRFSLRFASEPTYQNIGLCSTLLTVQFVAQLLLIPQGTLFGQIMFVASLAVSWIYNSYLSSLDKRKVQTEILMHNVLRDPAVKKYQLGTRTAMAVFAVLILDPADPARVLQDILPNDTKVWRRWRETVAQRIRSKETLDFTDDSNFDGFDERERKLLQTLYKDTEAAHSGYFHYHISS